MSESTSNRDDGTMWFVNSSDDNPDAIFGGSGPRYLCNEIVKLTLENVNTGGGVCSWQNTLPFPIIVVGAFIDVTTPATSECIVAVGTTGVSGTTVSNNLIPLQEVHAAAGVFGNHVSFEKVAVDAWVTASVVCGASSGLAGCLYLEFFPAT